MMQAHSDYVILDILRYILVHKRHNKKLNSSIFCDNKVANPLLEELLLDLYKIAALSILVNDCGELYSSGFVNMRAV